MSIRNIAHPARPPKPDWKDPASVKAYARAYAKFRRLFEADRLNRMQREWIAAHRDKARGIVKQSRARHPETSRMAKRQHHQKYKARQNEKRRQFHREHRAEQLAKMRRYARQNIGVIHAKNSAYRARKRGAAVGTDRAAYAAFVQRVKAAPIVRCYWCGGKTPKGERHIDHILPLSRGGKDDVLNLCCSCPACNLAKHDKTPEQFSGQFELCFSSQ